MAAMSTLSPGFYAAVLHAVHRADPYETSVVDVLSPLVSELTPAEASLFPEALAGILPLLSGDLLRLQFAVEIATLLDFWEIADQVMEIAVSKEDPRLILDAAGLAGSAAINGSRADRLLTAMPRRSDLQRAVEIRLRPDAQPQNPDEELLYLQRWPGARSLEMARPLAPVVVLDPTLDPRQSLLLAVELLRAGAGVRRLPLTHVPNWFGPDTALVCSPVNRSRVLSSYPRFSEAHVFVAPALRSDHEMSALLRRINAILPGLRRLRIDALRTELSESVWAPDVYTLGVYETHEASFLTAAPSSAFYRLAHKGLLEPRNPGVYVWAFRDLVAVRTWQYLKAQSGRRISSDIVPVLAGFAGDSDVVRLGATSTGRVLADRGSGWEDIESGAQVLDLPVEDVDDAFRPFSVGERRAPALLAASENTRLHPAILHGAPYRNGYRITARALASLDARNGYAAITSAYPELADVEISDTLEIGRQLAAAR